METRGQGGRVNQNGQPTETYYFVVILKNLIYGSGEMDGSVVKGADWSCRGHRFSF